MRSLLRDLEHSSSLEAHLVVSGTAPPEVEHASEILRSVITEALTNVKRHALAKAVLVSIRYEDDRVDVVIQDDEEGVSDLVLSTFQDSYLHFGLRNMRQQIASFGGTSAVDKGEERGTIVTISLPLLLQHEV